MELEAAFWAWPLFLDLFKGFFQVLMDLMISISLEVENNTEEKIRLLVSAVRSRFTLRCSLRLLFNAPERSKNAHFTVYYIAQGLTLCSWLPGLYREQKSTLPLNSMLVKRLHKNWCLYSVGLLYYRYLLDVYAPFSCKNEGQRMACKERFLCMWLYVFFWLALAWWGC